MKLVLSAAVALAATAAFAAPPDFSPDRITEHVRVLASDAFEGRAVGSAGEVKTVAYITEQFKAAGLRPGGDPLRGGGRRWTQNVPLLQVQQVGPATASVTVAGQTLELSQGEDVAMRPTMTRAPRVDIKNAPLVFVGYGVKAPDRNWDDFKGVDLKGKVILVLVNDPDFESGQGDFGGKAMTWYGRWPYKYEEAARQGALGVLVIHETDAASYGWPTVKNSNVAKLSDIVRPDPAKAHALLEGWIQRGPTVDIFRRAGLDFEALKRQAQTRDFRPVPLGDARFSASYAVQSTQVVSKNVVGIVPGKTHPDEYVLYSAHWDHLGVGASDVNGDHIFNGAVDNAAGVSLLIELARAFAHAPRPDRSVVFMSVTAEEQGLLGSEYYAHNPLYPLAKTAGHLNTDSPRPVAPARDFSTSGDSPNSLQADLLAAGAALGRRYVPDPRPSSGSFYRSDHFPLAKAGVPAFTLRSGDDLTEGGLAAGEAWQAEYTARRYHQPADNFDPATWRSDGLAADARLLFDTGERLANSREWPTWNAGSEFKAVRDQSAAARR